MLLLCALSGQAVAADGDRDQVSPSPATVACATATDLINQGDLDQAKAILTTLPQPGDDPCVEKALAKLDVQRENAAILVLMGQEHLRRSELEAAGDRFFAAQKADRSNPDAGAGLAQVTDLQKNRLSHGASNWQYFYSDWVSPIGRLLLPMALGVLVLGVLSSLASRFLVHPASDAWHPALRRSLIGLGLLMIAGTSALLPINAMFKPFTAGTPMAEAGGWLVLFVLLIVFGLMAGAALLLAREHRKVGPPGLKPRSVLRDWWKLLASLAVLPAIGILLWRTWLDEDQHGQVLMCYTILVLMGVLITAAGLGQNLRLLIEAQDPDGKTSAASTDYLLARMLTLGDDQPEMKVPLTQTPLSSLQSVDLTALPAGSIVSTIFRIFYTLRPDLTWRARVTEVDCNRVSITLLRNGRHANSGVFSRLDLGLPPLDDSASASAAKTATDRARAQLLTGAAAFILVTLSDVHHDLRNYLSGARNWKAVTLQVIASSRALIDDESQEPALLAKAVNEDPGHLTARFDYLFAVFHRQPSEVRDHIAFARAVEHCMIGNENTQVLAAAPQLDMRVRYTCAVHWLIGHLNSGRTDADALRHARTRAAEVVQLCKKYPRLRAVKRHRQVSWYARQMLPFAENLLRATDVLGKTSTSSGHPHDAAQYSPRLSLNHAALEGCLSLMTGSPAASTAALQDLVFALPDDRARELAQESPLLRPLQTDPGIRRLVGLPGRGLLDLDAFAGHSDYLRKHGLADPKRLLRATRSTAWHGIAAVHGIGPDRIRRWRDIAELALTHPLLNDPEILDLLDARDLASVAALQQRIHQGRPGLITDLKRAAEADRRTWLPGIYNPLPWLEAVEQANP
ncbi:hypothetical protein [Streptomyces pyridomyceticus]|uniref:hypothetical protein n=1 Tax=Streptomyces pyridomyceticus TaxID=68260 RepID=UPI000A5C1C77|nr:hypothetical protein [Streptomyces pyridomyceticus]